MSESKKTCFIIMPISTPAAFTDFYRDGAEHFEHVLNCLFLPAVEKSGYVAIPPRAKGSDIIHAGIIKNLESADLVLCDMSCLNPNVFFEFGIRTALNKPVCVVKDEITEEIPFDTGIINFQEYKSTIESWEIDSQIDQLSKHLKDSAHSSEGINSLWKYFGLKTRVEPYKGGDETDDRISSLSYQISSLSKKFDSLVPFVPGSHIRGAREVDKANRDELLAYIERFLPAGVELFGHTESTDGKVLLVFYTGEVDVNQIRSLRYRVKRRFGIRVVLESVDTSSASGKPWEDEGDDRKWTF